MASHRPFRRRGRLLATLLAAALCLTLAAPARGDDEAPAFVPADIEVEPEHQDGMWRMLVDDSVVYHTTVTLPVTIERVTYFPVAALLPYLGCDWQSDVSSRTLSVYRGEEILSFNIDTGQVLASDGREFHARTFYLNSTYYVPLKVILDEYGGSMVLLRDDSTGIHRLTTGVQRLSDREMLLLIETMSGFRVDQQARPQVNLLIRGASAGVDRMLSTLESAGLRAAFFVTAADIQEQPERILELAVAGHTIGIFAEAGTAAEVRAANDLLQKLIKTRTATVFATGYAATQELTSAGYLVWNHNLAATAAGEGVSVLNVLNRVGWRTAIFFNGSVTSADQLAHILNGLTAREQRLTAVGELTTPFHR